MVNSIDDKNPNGLRIIKTGRSVTSINKAAKNGFKPIVRKVQPSSKIRNKYSVFQNKKTGEIRIIGDYRGGFKGDDDPEYHTVIDWTFFYPYSFKSPFAAYLVPGDIKIGERVYLEDLIEDYIGSSWNQGDTYRLEGCEAIWNGKNFEIQYDDSQDRTTIIG